MWHGGALGDDGSIYGIPSNSKFVLKIVPSTNEVSTIGSTPLEGQTKYYGGIKGGDGAIYGIPYTACNVLKIVPSTGEILRAAFQLRV
jgi:hypothetical protein